MPKFFHFLDLNLEAIQISNAKLQILVRLVSVIS